MDVENTENEPNLDALIEAGEEIVSQIDNEVMFEREYGPRAGAPFSSDVCARYRNWSVSLKKYVYNHSDSVFLIDVEAYSADSAFEKLGDPMYFLFGQLSKPEIVELKAEIMRLIPGQVRALKKYRVEHSNKEVVNINDRTVENIHEFFYIIKEGEDFKYNGKFLDKVSKDADYYIVFNTLYSLLPQGGFVGYADISKDVNKYLPKTKRISKQKLTKLIQQNLNDKSNSFLHYAGIVNSVAGGKKLIATVRGKGFQFNNKKGA